MAHQMMKIQEYLHFPSLRDDLVGFLAKFEVHNVTEYSKIQWKHFVKNCIHQLSRDQILSDIQKYKKLDYLELSLEDFQMKDYFHDLNLELSRLKFRARSLTMKSCSSHYPSDPANIKKLFECEEQCKSIDSLYHWENSDCYVKFKKSDQFSSDRELCEFYKRIINHRLESSGVIVP